MGDKADLFIFTNGCPRRALDVSRLMNYFRLNDCRIVGKPENADYIIFVSCSFKKRKEEECLWIIKLFGKYKGELIVGGCLPKISPVKLRRAFKGRYFSTININEIDNLFPDFRIKLKDVPDANFQTYQSQDFSAFSKFARKFINGRNSRTASLRLSYGCPGKCSYCNITSAIGSLKSKPLDLCLDEYKKLLDKGYRNFVILADNVGVYGSDIGSNFGELLKSFSEADKGLNARWYIQELHPVWAVKYKQELLEAIKEKRIFALLCPVQSGSQRILRLMNRYSNVNKTLKTLREFKTANPDIILATHIIIGFPSETDNDFNATLNFIKKAGFGHVRLYPYYDFPNTPASKIVKKVEEEKIMGRLNLAAKFLDKEGIKWWCEELGSTYNQLKISKSGFSFGV